MSEKDDLVFDVYGKAIFRHTPFDPKFSLGFRGFNKLGMLKKLEVKYLIKDKRKCPRLPKETLDWLEETFVPVKEDPYIFIRKK